MVIIILLASWVDPHICPYRVIIFSIAGTSAEELRLDHRISYFRRLAYADSTKSTYRAQLRAYSAFCTRFGYKPVPAATITIARYVAHLSGVIAPASIQLYLNVVKLLHVERGYPNPLADNFYVSSLLKGISRRLSAPPSQKFPITPSILLRIHSRLDLSRPPIQAFWAACLVAFFTFFRKSTLICPVFSFKSLLALQTHAPSHYHFFSYPLPGGGFSHLTYASFTKLLSTTLHRAGISPVNYSGHSFRRGGASFAFSCGIPSDLIKIQRDWSSDAYLRYLTSPLSSRQKLVLSMSQHIQKIQ